MTNVVLGHASGSDQMDTPMNDSAPSHHPDNGTTHPPPSTTNEEDPTSEFEDWEEPFLEMSSRLLRRLGFDDPNPTRREREEKPAPSGVLLPKQTCNPKVPVKPNRKVKDASQRVHKPLLRYTQWRLTPSETLARSPLNPTTTRACLPLRKNVTLCGSEDYVWLSDASRLSCQKPCIPGTTLPGSTSEKRTADPPHPTVLKVDRQPDFPPPPVKRKGSKLRLGGILSEYRFMQRHLNSWVLLDEQIGRTIELAKSICTAGDAKLTPPEKVAKWEYELACLSAMMTSLCNMLACKAYYNHDGPAMQRVRDWLKNELRSIRKLLLCLPRQSKATYGVLDRRVVNRYSCGKKGLGTTPQGDPQPGGAGPTSKPSQLSQHPSAQSVPGNEPATATNAHTLQSEYTSTIQIHDSTSALLSVSEPETRNLELLLEEIDAIPFAPTLPESSNPNSILESLPTQVDPQTIAVIANSEGDVPQQPTPPSTPENETLALATVSTDDHVLQQPHILSPRKRSADGDSTQNSTLDVSEERPSKRRCIE
ncbi:hypothetical protein FRC12_001194 [Ceratobasidium sp. 428]|nr:hypothetical protein FRC12_001194 [Ceratobasidium sp. 428]